jgi:anti-anti-sigma factor
MRFEALDITIETRDNLLWLILSGPFHREQVPNIREKIRGLLSDGNREFVIDLEQVTQVDESAPPMILELLNTIRDKGGELRLVYRNRAVSEAFGSYRNIFPVFADAETLRRPGLLGFLHRSRRRMRRKTGVRLSVPVALFLLFILVGWFLSLALVIHWQGLRITEQERELRELTLWRNQTLIELTELQELLRPMEQLGIVEGPKKEASGK